MAQISEDRVDLIEEKMRAKIDTLTGFSDVEGKSRALEKVRGTALPTITITPSLWCVVCSSPSTESKRGVGNERTSV